MTVNLSDTLIVPMDLAVLCVGDTDVNGSVTNPYGTKDFARLAPDFSRLPFAANNEEHNAGPFLSSQVLADTFQEASAPLDVGLHLHWVLPEALSHGAQKDDGSIGFPSAPDRWLIVRVATNAANPQAPVTSLKAWVLESDRLWDGVPDHLQQNKGSLAIPIRPDPTVQPNKSWKSIGRVFDYEGWAEDPSAERAGLTAVGYGHVSYAATYQLCPNVFGFWDTMDDLDPAAFPPGSTRVSYMLMGWHADAADDPMARIDYPPGATYEQKLAEIAQFYKWSFAADAQQDVPGRTAYNALMTDIPWDRKTHYIDQREANSGAVQIAVGNSTSEALSAMLAAQPDLSGVPNVELALNALQLGLLSRLQLPGGLRNIDEAIHQSGFASTSNGTVWVVEPVPAQAGDLTPGTLSNLPEKIGDALNALNAAQAVFDALAREIETLQARIFADWCRYMQIEYATLPPVSVDISPDDARAFIKDEVTALDDLVAQQAQQQSEIDRSAVALEKLLTSDFSLTQTDGPRFWNPADPVILLMGDDVRSSSRFNPIEGQDDAGNLLCRTGPNLITAMAAGNFTLAAASLPALPANGAVPLAAAPALLGEAFFLDPVQACVLASGIAAQGGTDNPALKDFTGFLNAVEAAQIALFSGDPAADIQFDGLPPIKLSFQTWSSPWAPFMIQWTIEHYPNAMPPYDPDFIVGNYVLDDEDIDLAFKRSIPVSGQGMRTYDGSIVLTNNTEINIRQQIDTYLRDFPDDDIDKELREILSHLKLPAQAQALSGFNDAFLMLANQMQMEVSDPLGILRGLIFSNFTNTLVKQAVAGMNVNSPLQNNTFSALRNGGFKVVRIRVIDTFGQPLDIDQPDVIRAESMIPPAETEPLINLPIRSTQPLQMNFDWVSADNDAIEMNSDPATTPVFGWVLFNHLDQALMIYDGAGHALGSFNLLGPFWQGAPGNQASYGRSIDEVFASANPHLRNFALGVASAADPAGYLHEILAAIDKSLSFVAPGGSPPGDSLSVFIGRPVALTRAALDVNAFGLPAINQSKAAFKSAIEGGKPFERDTGRIPEVKVPVRLGDLGDISDGLIGYFIDNGQASAYRTFYSPAATPRDKHGVVAPAFDQIVLTTGQSEPLFVSIFVDPNAAIHATTGILPMKELTIPPSLIADDLAQMAVTFLATPVINAGDGAMPVPDESGYAWQWVTQVDGVGEWTVMPVTQVNGVSLLQQQVQEGWLMLEHTPAHLRSTSDDETGD